MSHSRLLAGAGCALAFTAMLAGCAGNSYHDMAISPQTPGAASVGASVAPEPTPMSGSDDGQAIETAYQCGPQRVHTRYAEERMTLRVGDAVFPLEQAISASGARYTGDSAQGPITFWGRGNEATLSVGSYTYPTCVEVPGARRGP